MADRINTTLSGVSPEKFSQKVLDKFWAKVLIPQDANACWEWQGHLCRGYGNFDLPGRRKIKAHRMSWIIANGEIQENMKICHKCDNPKCVRPDHLFVGTQADNIMDAVRKGRIKPPHLLGVIGNPPKEKCSRGHPLSGDNLLIDYRGNRRCRACYKDAQRRWDIKNRRKVLESVADNLDPTEAQEEHHADPG